MFMGQLNLQTLQFKADINLLCNIKTGKWTGILDL